RGRRRSLALDRRMAGQVLEVAGSPAGAEAAGRAADRKDGRACVDGDHRTGEGGVAHGYDGACGRVDLLAVDGHAGVPGHHEVDLLLAEVRLVVWRGDRVAGRLGDERVDAEGGQAEVVLDRLPGRVARVRER